MKKGQAALEFLMTYGWAILVVLAAIGALAYFGVLNPSNLLPDTCVPSTGWACPGKPQITSNSITFSIVNGQGYDVTSLSSGLFSVSGGGVTGCTGNFYRMGTTTPTTEIRNGEGATIVLSSCSFPDTNTVKTDVMFTYTNPNSALNETARFTINGKVK